MERLGREARGPGRIYLTGGATALLYGWRLSTMDVDLSMDPEPPGIFEAIATLKDELDVNIELASPGDFLPRVPGWRERSVYIDTFGDVQFFHYDPCSQALAKIERGHRRDLDDVRGMLAHGLFELSDLTRHFGEIEGELIRFPSVDPDEFRRKLESFTAAAKGGT